MNRKKLKFVAGSAVHLFATTSMGIFLGTIARSMPQFGLLLLMVLLPLQVLSGGMTPRESMPDAVQFIMQAAPWVADRLHLVRTETADAPMPPVANTRMPARAAGDPSISARSALLGDPIVAGSMRGYQAWYRNADPAFCTPST